MNNKEKYIKSIDNLKADEYLKSKVLKEIKEPKKKTGIIALRVAVAAMFVFSCIWLMTGKEGVIDNSIYQNQDITQISKNIHVVENFEQLKSLIETRISIRDDMLKGWSTTDAVVNEAALAINSESKTSYSKDSDYSKTNVQVEGIDEADIVKTDGKYIYYSGDPCKIKIFGVEEQKIVAEIELYKKEEEDGTQNIYINGNDLYVISVGYRGLIKTMNDTLKPTGYWGNTTTDIYVYNVADKNNIVLEKKYSLEGNYKDSRLIGDNLYVISNQFIRNMNNEEEVLPYYISEDDTVKSVAYKDIYYITDDNNSYINIMAINKNGETKVKSILGNGSNVYVSQNNIYITQTVYKEQEEWNGWARMIVLNDLETAVYKFGISDGNIEIKESTKFYGSLLNQFSMDEYNGYFRVATTSTRDGKNYNNLYIYDARLNEVGKLTDLAENESIYAVRFMGEKAYIVTFERVDPLFVIDLSNPREPRVLGELKVPGFSNYLHPYDETHLIGVGQNTVDNGRGGVKSQGIKISLFDVTNPINPVELSSLVIGEKNGAYSEALYNHKAILYIKEQGILALPITIYDYNHYYSETFNGVEVLKIDLINGVKEKGRIAEQDKESRHVDRVLFVKDKLYSINNKGIVVNNLNTLEELNRVNI